MSADPTLLGTVQNVAGVTVKVAVDQNIASGLMFIDGHGYRIGQIGSYIRIPIGLTDLFGIVTQVAAGASHRWISVQLIGEGQRSGKLKKGISEFPTYGDEAHLVTDEDLTRISGGSDSPGMIQIGRLASVESIPAMVDVNSLITHNSAVVGATGSGKSTAVTSLLASLTDSERFPSARVILFDLRGEYQAALGDQATVFRVNADESRGEKPLHIPYWALDLEGLLSMTPFQSTTGSDRAAIVEKIAQLRTDSLVNHPRPGVTADTLTADAPVPFSIHRLWYDLHRYVCSTHSSQGSEQTGETEAIEVDDRTAGISESIGVAFLTHTQPCCATAAGVATRSTKSITPS